MESSLTIAIEGCIGVGKSTAIDLFSKDIFYIIKEPIEKWSSCCDENLLELLYHDPKAWSATFQSYVLLTMMDSHTKPIDLQIKLMERSLFSGRNIFMELARQRGDLNSIQFYVLNEWYERVIQKWELRLDLIVYLKCDPIIALERIRKRGRPGEEHIGIEFMTQLHELHEKWIARASCPVIVLDANVDEEKMKELVKNCQESIIEQFSN